MVFWLGAYFNMGQRYKTRDSAIMYVEEMPLLNNSQV